MPSRLEKRSLTFVHAIRNGGRRCGTPLEKLWEAVAARSRVGPSTADGGPCDHVAAVADAETLAGLIEYLRWT